MNVESLHDFGLGLSSTTIIAICPEIPYINCAKSIARNQLIVIGSESHRCDSFLVSECSLLLVARMLSSLISDTPILVDVRWRTRGSLQRHLVDILVIARDVSRLLYLVYHYFENWRCHQDLFQDHLRRQIIDLESFVKRGAECSLQTCGVAEFDRGYWACVFSKLVVQSTDRWETTFLDGGLGGQ